MKSLRAGCILGYHLLGFMFGVLLVSSVDAVPIYVCINSGCTPIVRTDPTLPLPSPNGNLVNILNVPIGASLYDVAFVDGTFDEIFGADQPRFEFTTMSQAFAAAQALSDTLVDIAPDQFYDSSPDLERGCAYTREICEIMTPYEIQPGIPAFRHIDFFNDNPFLSQTPADSISSLPGVLDARSQDTGGDEGRTFAVWRVAGGPPDAGGNANPLNRFFDPPYYGVAPVAIPEPVTLALVGLGLAGIGASRRRKLP